MLKFSNLNITMMVSNNSNGSVKMR